GNVIQHSHPPLVGLGGGAKHVFQPIGAIGDLHRAPVGAVGLHPTLPVDMESQDVSIESVFNSPVADNEPGVDHAAGHAFSIGLSCLFRALDELDVIAFGILHPKAAASIRPALDALWHRHSLS